MNNVITQLMHKLFFSNTKPFYQTLISFNIKLYNLLKPDKIIFSYSISI